MMEKVI